MSRWLVGSSSSSRSGADTSALPSSTRRRQPPDSSPIASIGRADRGARRSARLSARGASRRALRAGAAASPSRSSAAGPDGGVDGGVMVGGDQRAELAEARRRPRRTRCDRRLPGTSCSSRAMRSPGARQIDPAVGRRLARDDAQQRRLAGPVAADQADALARLDPEIGVLHERQVSKGQRDVIEREEGHERDVRGGAAAIVTAARVTSSGAPAPPRRPGRDAAGRAGRCRRTRTRR